MSNGTIGVNASVTDGGALTYYWHVYWFYIERIGTSSDYQAQKSKITELSKTSR